MRWPWKRQRKIAAMSTPPPADSYAVDLDQDEISQDTMTWQFFELVAKHGPALMDWDGTQWVLDFTDKNMVFTAPTQHEVLAKAKEA